METLRGELVRAHPLGALEKKADLVFFEGPLVSLFENLDGDPYLFVWADVDNESNRWIVFRVSQARLSAFLKRSVTMRELVTQPSDGFLYVADLDDASDYKDVWVVQPTELPAAYLPAANSYYDFEPISEDFDLKSLAERYKSPLLDLHLLRGKGIRFGTADVVTLGSMLRSTGELAESVAITLFTNRRGTEGLSRESARAYGQFEYVTQKAASFSAILRPLMAQETLPGFGDRTSEVIDVIVELLSTTSDYEGLKRAAEKYPDVVLRHLEELVTRVNERELAVEVRWALPTADAPKRAIIDRASSEKILANINRLEEEEAEGFYVQGTFLAVDTKLRSYRFLSVAGRESTGRFASKMAYPLTHISFEAEYRVYVNRSLVKRSGQKRIRTIDVIGELEPIEQNRLGLG